LAEEFELGKQRSILRNRYSLKARKNFENAKKRSACYDARPDHCGTMKTRLPTFESLDQMAEATAAGLSQTAAASAYNLFCDKEFRRLAGFERLNQVEQDRIFNELVVAFLVLIMLLFEAPDLCVPREQRNYLADLNKRVSEAYVENLRTLGVETTHLREWKKLISMRYEEYARDKHDVRGAAMKIESAEKSLDLDGLARIQLLVPVQAVSIGCHDHICRGIAAGQDELFKHILRSLSKFYVELRVRLEGGKITPLMRARLRLKRMLQRLSRKSRTR
jgi:hypothetical protein